MFYMFIYIKYYFVNFVLIVNAKKNINLISFFGFLVVEVVKDSFMALFFFWTNLESNYPITPMIWSLLNGEGSGSKILQSSIFIV